MSCQTDRASQDEVKVKNWVLKICIHANRTRTFFPPWIWYESPWHFCLHEFDIYCNTPVNNTHTLSSESCTNLLFIMCNVFCKLFSWSFQSQCNKADGSVRNCYLTLSWKNFKKKYMESGVIWITLSVVASIQKRLHILHEIKSSVTTAQNSCIPFMQKTKQKQKIKISMIEWASINQSRWSSRHAVGICECV